MLTESQLLQLDVGETLTGHSLSRIYRDAVNSGSALDVAIKCAIASNLDWDELAVSYLQRSQYQDNPEALNHVRTVFQLLPGHCCEMDAFRLIRAVKHKENK